MFVRTNYLCDPRTRCGASPGRPTKAHADVKVRLNTHPVGARLIGACMAIEDRNLEAGPASNGKVSDTTVSDGRGRNYKWIALSNTTLGILMVTINQSILLISLPALFRGINLNPLVPVEHLVLPLGVHGLHSGHGRTGGQPRPRRRHLRPGQDVQPGLRRLHGVLDPALGDLHAGRGRRAVDHHHARVPGRRRRDAVRQLDGDPDRCVPRRRARQGAWGSTASPRLAARSWA